MNFASFPYLLFLIVVVVIYFIIRKCDYRNSFLLFASYFFYSIFGIGFSALMLLTSIITYVASYYSYYSNSKKKRRLYFYIGLSLDLLIFILFKYIHIIDLDIMNWPNWSVQKLLIPIGISFYTFKTIGYCIDVYKRKYTPENSFVYYALSVSFFPQLIAGPIEKSVVISSQLKQNNEFKVQNAIEGSKLIVWGLFKKIVIADSIALIINPVFNDIHSHYGFGLFIVFFAFAYQVYIDFSAYSDIAIGSAKFFNVNLPANFNKPYFSKNYREFWSRWHITFSKWLKEYVFDELGGYSKVRIVFNLFLVFLIVGLWHGATLNFIIYAQLAFMLLLIDIATKNTRYKVFRLIGIDSNSVMMKVINYFAMVLMIAFLSIFFRVSEFNESIYILKNMFSFNSKGISIQGCTYIFMCVFLFEFLQFFQMTGDGHCFQRVNHFYLRFILYILMFFSVLILSNRAEVTFQYFQF